MFKKSVFVSLTLIAAAHMSSMAVAQELAAEEYCQRAQQIVAKTSLVALVEIPDNQEAFVKSKALLNPLTVQQYLSNPVSEENDLPRVVSCKMKTAERINAAQPVAAGQPAIAGGDGSCQAVHSYWLEQLYAKIPAQQRAFAPEQLVIDEEELTFIGPMWLRPWPFEPLYRADDGVIHIRSKALYVPFSWWIPMPDRFKGTYYCHLISPDYLEAIVRGETQPGL
jgi:hypothetical protein